MAVGKLFGRALNYVLNELVVEGLANSRTFQRFAVRTSKALEDMSAKVQKAMNQFNEWSDLMLTGAYAVIYEWNEAICIGNRLF